MNMKLLYLDVDGVLLGKAKPDDVRVALAKHAGEFIEYCLQHYECYWLTTHCPDGDSTPVIDLLKMYVADKGVMKLIETIHATSWRMVKIEAIDLESDFYWIEDRPTSYEIEQLERHNALHRLIQVDTRRNPDDLKRAMSLLEETSLNGHKSITRASGKPL